MILPTSRVWSSLFFFFNDTATTEIYTLSLHDALPISLSLVGPPAPHFLGCVFGSTVNVGTVSVPSCDPPEAAPLQDRKSTRLNSSHLVISYAVFCLKKKRKL